jgi:hypothetical protein
MGSVIYTVRVVDTWCGTKGWPDEECITTHKGEADSWFKQWKEEYSKANGYDGFRVTMETRMPEELCES